MNVDVAPLAGPDRDALLQLAAGAIRHALETGRRRLPDEAALSGALARPGATFVTLERGEQLLGCIGTLEAVRPLGVDVAYHALAAAFADPRLPPVDHDDYAAMSIKVSRLTVPEPIPTVGVHDLAAHVRPGVDGLVLDAGRHRSTLLPSVWEKLPDVDDFLVVLWRKAGLAPGVWPSGTEVRRYTAEEVCDPGPRPPAARRR